MRVAVLGDIGQPVYHVGDEAMTHAAVEELAARDIDSILLFSRDVEDTLARYSGVEAAPTLQFPWPPNDRRDYLRRIRDVVAGDHSQLPPSDQVWGFIEALRSCDALLIAGGGNMNSIYGWLLYERAAAVSIAHSLGKPVVLGGQTLGPTLYGEDGATAERMVRKASLVGGREAFTVQLLREFDGSARIGECLDDAAFFAASAGDWPATEASLNAQRPSTEPALDLPTQYAAVTFSAPSGIPSGSAAYLDFIESVAAFLNHAQQISRLPLVFLPHMASPGAGDGDEATHRDIVAAMGLAAMGESPQFVLPIQTAHRTASLTSGAALVLTSRYHPVIFAMETGAPVVAVASDNYSGTRLSGALAHWGLEDFALSSLSLLDGTARLAVEEAWSRRGEIRAHCATAGPQRRQEFTAWWNDVVSALRGETFSTPTLSRTTQLPAAGPWGKQAAAVKSAFLRLSAEVEELRVVREQLTGDLDLARRDTDAARSELQGWFASRSFRAVRGVASLRARIEGK
ncbi:hypothetical protein GCM10027404_09200 [Arthrobacter tumbae]|uniref:polysaccharide pyruvyl transferase family protein n=1 Tax=Arthrobacter tumbae TaxID=163874 RepID=UPI00195B1EEE|nr:polysaccharide pyruvyl transferase family protein [Arthrobacter tumbae]MBM7782201.1 polysaccharide pyruvyl transferase WcaK-like protein [Arthrobacter tumbae]